MKLAIVNGPNLNLTGKREKEIYGSQSFEEYFNDLKIKYSHIAFSYFQSNVEGEIINFLHQTGFDYDGIILNAGAYTHTSLAIADAVAAISTPVVEVHISNVYKRETFRHQSLIAKNCKGIIIGFGLKSYDLAVQSFM